MSKQPRTEIYAFIDSQNLNLGTSKDITVRNKKIYRGWKLDFAKFYRYLADKFRVTKSFLFIGYIKENQKLYSYLTKVGYQVIYKTTTKDGNGKPKGNVDAELVLHAAAIEFKNYAQAVVVSGDGDFACLHDFLLTNNKLKKIVIPNSHSESKLLSKFSKYKVYIQYEKDKLSQEISNKKGRRNN